MFWMLCDLWLNVQNMAITHGGGCSTRRQAGSSEGVFFFAQFAEHIERICSNRPEDGKQLYNNDILVNISL